MFVLPNINSFIIGTCLCFFIQSCGSDKTSDVQKGPEGTVAFDLASYGKPFAICVPDTSERQFSITEEQDGALNIVSGKNFGMSVYEQSVDIAIKKEDIKSDDVNKLRRIVKEEPQGLIWESAIVEPEFHFVRNITVNGSEYSFCDIPGTAFTEQAILLMYDCASLPVGKQQ